MPLDRTPRSSIRSATSSASILATLLVVFGSPAAHAQTTVVVSTNAAGDGGNTTSYQGVQTPDGRWVAFVSASTNLVPGVSDGQWHVFLRDTADSSIEVVDVSSAGQLANAGLTTVAESISISDDGRYVLFRSPATNLVAGDTNGASDLFRHDRLTGETRLVSSSPGGGILANGGRSHLSARLLSADGRYALFIGQDPSLPGYNSTYEQLYRKDMLSGATELVSSPGGLNSAFGYSLAAAISPNGRFVAFRSDAPNLVGGDTNGTYDVFLSDRTLGTIRRVSVATGGGQSFEFQQSPGYLDLSSDGRFVVFDSGADDLFPGDVNGKADVFLHDTATTTTELLSVSSSGVRGNDSSFHPTVSDDGRFVAFSTFATNLVDGVAILPNPIDVLLRDRTLGTTQLVNTEWPGGGPTNGVSADPRISPDGRRVIFAYGGNDVIRPNPHIPDTWQVYVKTLQPFSSLTFTTVGPGGPIPSSGTGGGGTWPTALPPSAFSSASLQVHESACQIEQIELRGLSHTWIGDLQILLASPSGGLYNLVHRPGFNGSGNGSNGDATGGDYVIVAPGTPGAAVVPGSGNWTPGTYQQSFGVWPSGQQSIRNLPLDQIPVEAGRWFLVAIDWAAGDTGACASWTAAGLQGLPFTMEGPGGPVPALGSGGGGTWPTVLPPDELSSTASTGLPPGVCKVTAVELEDLTHSYVGDLQVVLHGPGGVGVDLVHRPGFTGSGNGSSGDVLPGLHELVSPETPGATVVPASGPWASGRYGQYHGEPGGLWPGNLGIWLNPLVQTVTSAGPWRLAIYDWAAGDTGSLGAWRVRGYYLGRDPRTYCTPSTTTHGCSPSISASDHPSVSGATDCLLTVQQAEGNKSGILFYSITGRSSTPWATGSTSTLCIAPPRKRTGVQNSGGTPGQCNGLYSLDWNTYQLGHTSALGQPWVVGRTVWVQCWFRDPPAPRATNLSDAVEMVYVP